MVVVLLAHKRYIYYNEAVKKIFFLLSLFCVLIAVGSIVYGWQHTSPVQNRTLPSPTVTGYASAQSPIASSLIVPYWGVNTPRSDTPYDVLLYFGIAPTIAGISTADAGYRQLTAFQAFATEAEEKLLILRMLDSKQNFTIIESATNRERVISKTVALAQEYGFDGVVLDLEVQALPFDSVVANITAFTKALARATKQEQLSFGMLMYGDVFYRLRPFDMQTLASEIDQVYIMAYDFHKAGGNPGPNFPLSGNETYGYDLQKMIADYAAVMPKDKTTIVFGMFGYDWVVDENGIAKEIGKSKSMREMQAFIATCDTCESSRDSRSGETKVSYQVGGKRHIIWFEDMQSVKQKQAYLQEHGYNAFSFWAHSYF
jgi:hypothetical protein